MPQITGGVLQFVIDGASFIYKFTYYSVTTISFMIWSLLFPERTPLQAHPLRVTNIDITETYSSKIKVSGLGRFQGDSPKGEIKVTIPFDKNKHIHNRVLSGNRANRLATIEQLLSSAELGLLRVVDYGGSNLNKQFYLNIRDDTISLNINTQEIQVPDIRNVSNFDVQLDYEYSPEPIQKYLVNLNVEVLDADADMDEQTIKKFSSRKKGNDQSLFEQIKKQADVNPELIVRFQLHVLLPTLLAQDLSSVNVDRMTLSWPLNLPHWKAQLFLKDSHKSEPFYYNPEQHLIEWKNFPVMRAALKHKNVFTLFKSNFIRLKIKDPSEIYLLSELTGQIYIELDGLLSGMELDYDSFGNNNLVIKKRSVLTTKYTLNLDECFTQRYYYPKQHLYFPGVVLNDARMSDVFMLLRDGGFNVIDDEGSESFIEDSSNRQTYYRRIKASKEEGSKELVLWLFLEGYNSITLRERKIEGKNQYTTELPTGSLMIDIWGQLQGDYKRVVNVINEIQMQLKEQFRHVSVAD